MKKKTYIKTTTLGIICILLGSMILTTAVSGEHINKLQQSQTLENNEPTSSETVDIKIQLSGSTEDEISVTLTQQQAQQFDQRIQLFKQQLEQTQTDQQTTQVFIDMIHYLDAENMLPSHLSVQQAIQQVLPFYTNNKQMKSLLKQINPNTIMGVETDNSYCLIAGRSTNTIIIPQLVPLKLKELIVSVQNLVNAGHLDTLKILISYCFFELQRVITLFIDGIKNGNFSLCFIVVGTLILLIGIGYVPLAITSLIILFFLSYKPVTIASTIGYGAKIPHGPGPASGWLFSAGLQGMKSWEGLFYGESRGFCGIKIYTFDSGQFFYFGSAVAVKIQ